MNLISWLRRKLGVPPQFYKLPLTQEEREKRNFDRTVGALLIWIGCTTLVLALCALRIAIAKESKHPWADAISLFCHAELLGWAFAAVGGLIGFLFGIPRMDSSTAASKPKPNEPSGSNSNSTSAPAQSTNLEQVSDWLTKIILGAGLTQLVKIPEKIKALGVTFEADFNSRLLPEAIAVHSAILGFFIGYLITRLFLAGAFVTADRGASTAADVSRVLLTADSLASKSDYSAAATALETAFNSLGPDTPRETKLLYYERLTYTSLYEPPPTGFQKAIDFITRYLTQEPQPPSALLYVNLACAYGQLYEWERKNQNRESALKDARDRALNAVREALRLDPGQKSVLHLVWSPNISKMKDEENDLEVFSEDSEFRSLLA